MQAAVVESFEVPPRYRDMEAPFPQAGEVIVSVRAASLSQLVRAQASGKHYSSGTPPVIPGVDGVGVLPDGQRVYFAFPRAPFGAMAEQVAVNAAHVVPLPDTLDDVTAAALANPGMASWAALTLRAGIQPGETVLINGANGASGRLAIQIAKHLGASRVIAAARNPASESELRALGANDFVRLQEPRLLVEQFREKIDRGIDIVLDFLWGAPASAFFAAASSHGSGQAAPRIRFINIGSLAGADLILNASVLRSSGIELLGSGLGSVSHVALVQAIAKMLQAAGAAGLSINAEARSLSDVEQIWQEKSEARIVFVP